MEKRIKVAKDFTDVPGPRYRGEGPYSGELFREKFLVPILKRGDSIFLDLDDTEGYGSSFLEEAFGGLVRIERFAANELLDRINFQSRDQTYVEQIRSYIRAAKPGEGAKSK